MCTYESEPEYFMNPRGNYGHSGSKTVWTEVPTVLNNTVTVTNSSNVKISPKSYTKEINIREKYIREKYHTDRYFHVRMYRCC